MPYIRPELRVVFDPAIDELQGEMNQFHGTDKLDGIANYIISRLVASAFKPDAGWNYVSAARATAAFDRAKDEFVRRVLATYEDKCIARNGDIPEYGE